MFNPDSVLNQQRQQLEPLQYDFDPLNNQIESDRVTREWDKFEAEQAAKTATSEMRAESFLFLWCCQKRLITGGRVVDLAIQ